MDMQYSQAAVFTPCDFAFPSNGIKSEATPNTEMILVADVDLSLLNELPSFGLVRNLRDRRTDVYCLTLLTHGDEARTIEPEEMNEMVLTAPSPSGKTGPSRPMGEFNRQWAIDKGQTERYP